MAASGGVQWEAPGARRYLRLKHRMRIAAAKRVYRPQAKIVCFPDLVFFDAPAACNDSLPSACYAYLRRVCSVRVLLLAPAWMVTSSSFEFSHPSADTLHTIHGYEFEIPLGIDAGSFSIDNCETNWSIQGTTLSDGLTDCLQDRQETKALIARESAVLQSRNAPERRHSCNLGNLKDLYWDGHARPWLAPEW
ncbi:hypothetical protein NM208_g15589 [Fusarium decemcellulare]|uniref:Uncharacterized protein n=1 Tax=Fusarium decemcellulare TaxID=57161 RepID=A0ACC1RCL3_9HYPO|nr:hypothetical protein NM208_g15589 [Fusarium decemcellulare]